MNPEPSTGIAAESLAKKFFGAPFAPRTYGNLLFLLLCFPLGVFYFVFLTAGLTVGVSLTLIWIGLAILFLVFAGIWGLTAFERAQAVYLLGARIPPMRPPAGELPQGFFQRIGAFFKNPVTWKGMAYLLVKFPLGILTFVPLVTLISLSAALVLAPFYYEWPGIDMLWWQVDTLSEALLCSAIGLATLLVSLNVLNGLAFVWRLIATQMLGSERFA